MIRRKPSLFTIADEETISFLMHTKRGGLKPVTSLSMEAFLDATAKVDDLLPADLLRSANQLLVVPDYWVGNHFQEFQSSKKKVIAAFIERKLKLEQPALADAGNFYSYAVVKGQGRHLYTFYLQELVAYQVYQRLAHFGIGPVRITTPALMWQARLMDVTDGFADQGVGFIHMEGEDCFLYFFFMGRFLFSRQIQLPEIGEDDSDPYSQLNYEINQSFYLYSQKTKCSVDALYMLAADPAATERLSELLGREVLALPCLPTETDILEDAIGFSSCRSFTSIDLNKPGDHCIQYKPLKIELAWLPVQWAGIAVGMLLAILLTVEAGYLHFLSTGVAERIDELKTTSGEPPEQVLEGISLSIDEIAAKLSRPSGSGSVMRALLAMPDGVSVRKISLTTSGSPRLEMDAAIKADSPDAFKQTLEVFIDQINHRFSLSPHTLREQDVTIQLNRSAKDEKKPVYLIKFGFGIP